MAKVVTDNKHYKAIANAVRECIGNGQGAVEIQDAYRPSDLPQAVRDVWYDGTCFGENTGLERGYDRGYEEGYTNGKMDGYEQGVEAGKPQGVEAFLRGSRHLNATLSGAVVAANDVYPVEHDVALQLSSDTLTDFSGVTVRQYGRNLCPKAPTSTTHNGITYTQNEDGTVTANGTATAVSYFDIVTSVRACPKVPVGTKLYISGCPEGGSSTTYYLYFPWVGWYEYGKGLLVNVTNSTFANNWRQSMRIEIKSGVTVENLVFKPQVEVERFSAYTPYEEPTLFTAWAGGVLHGVRSRADGMTLMTDVADVTISCTYLRDADAYIDTLLAGESG